ncbi:LPS-assembly protein LptD [Methylophaga lonarensis]|uniref:LPS-assembly protein LptD n=1 Tax=Methylophaga lonarensis TaxID=999151 RepID=UPI003D29F633
MRKLVFFSAGIVSCLSSVSFAQEDMLCKRSTQDVFLPFAVYPEEPEVQVEADTAQIRQSGTSVFTGNVDVIRGGQQLNADHARYNQQTGEVHASGNVRLRDSDIVLRAQEAEWSMVDDEGALLDVEYQTREMHARGRADNVYRQGMSWTSMKNATYTTCMEGDDTWLLSAGRVYLDHDSAVGEATNVVVRVKGVPIFYTPYINFPLNDERKSGFLPPSIGNSSKNGFDVSTPYYWNIAPNRDATITPRYMGDRGLLLSGQYRYLYEGGEGQIEAGFLSSDNKRRDGELLNPNYRDDRKHFTLQHLGDSGSNWFTEVDYNYVSDRQYLEDFGTNLSLTSTTHLNRLLRVGYSNPNWTLNARLHGYQTVADVSRPYQRLPQIVFRGNLPDQAFGLSYEMKAEYVMFDHSDRVRGQRVDLEPGISLPMGTPGMFLTPRVAVRHTRYDLNNTGDTDFNRNINRTLPVLSLDSGLFFERPLSFRNGRYTQTLEPRAFYLYIPERNQDRIPVFDTNLRTFGMASLFSHDRFTGTDRVGDANQLTVGLTSRFINNRTGREGFRMTVGQIRYFTDRDVVLPDRGEVGRRSDSDIVAEVVAAVTRSWSVAGEMQWDARDSKSSMSSAQIRYRGDDGGVFNIGHRYRRDSSNFLEGLEQIDVSAALPVNERWSVIGRYYRSIKDGRNLEMLAGFEYRSCCWATRLVYRDYLKYSFNDAFDDAPRNSDRRDKAIFLEFELKGLGSFGKRSDSLLQRSIIGYQN